MLGWHLQARVQPKLSPLAYRIERGASPQPLRRCSGVALEHRQEILIDRDLVPLLRLPTQLSGPLR